MDLVSFSVKAEDYLQGITQAQVPWWHSGKPFVLTPLAQGEYNMNYLVHQDHAPTWVFRVNVGSQINRPDQINYEFQALKLLQESGRTPIPIFVDDSKTKIEFGVLGMHYILGTMMQYERQALEAARLFADIHSISHALEKTHLIQEQKPLTMTYEECAGLLPTYLNSPLADKAIADFLREVLDWADHEREEESYFISDPWNCIINTEVNSSNFIYNQDKNSLHLVDWEKPLWGDPSQDLSHFCVPTTTLWKTDYHMGARAKAEFLQTYCDNLPDQHLKNTIHDRVRLRDPFNCLRGISWSAWAWIAYQTGEAAIKNKDTYQKLCIYMNIDFIRSLFEPYMKGVTDAG